MHHQLPNETLTLIKGAVSTTQAEGFQVLESFCLEVQVSDFLP